MPQQGVPVLYVQVGRASLVMNRYHSQQRRAAGQQWQWEWQVVRCQYPVRTRGQIRQALQRVTPHRRCCLNPDTTRHKCRQSCRHTGYRNTARVYSH